MEVHSSGAQQQDVQCNLQLSAPFVPCHCSESSLVIEETLGHFASSQADASRRQWTRREHSIGTCASVSSSPAPLALTVTQCPALALNDCFPTAPWPQLSLLLDSEVTNPCEFLQLCLCFYQMFLSSFSRLPSVLFQALVMTQVWLKVTETNHRARSERVNSSSLPDPSWFCSRTSPPLSVSWPCA